MVSAQGTSARCPPTVVLCQISGMQERALTPFPLFLLVGLDLEDATARAPGHLVCLHAYLLRHLRSGKKESGATASSGKSEGMPFPERKEGGCRDPAIP